MDILQEMIVASDCSYTHTADRISYSNIRCGSRWWMRENYVRSVTFQTSMLLLDLFLFKILEANMRNCYKYISLLSQFYIFFPESQLFSPSPSTLHCLVLLLYSYIVGTTPVQLCVRPFISCKKR